MAESHNLVSDPRLYILLVALSSAVLVVTLYHCTVICCCNRNSQPRQTRRRLRPETTGLTDGGMGPSSASELIPARKYQKDVGLVLVGDGMCAVCISDFEDGEEFRTLPECMHSFHVSCIDMWLFSHSSCPICRADATLSSLVVRRLPDLESGNLESR